MIWSCVILTFWLETTYRYLAIYTANGPAYHRIVDVSAHYDGAGDPDYLTVTLDVAIGASSGDNVIKAISYMNLCRLDDDEVKLTHTELDTTIDLTIKAVNK